jgi:peptidoglycan/LPS O-acetylase OafA/YrhL
VVFFLNYEIGEGFTFTSNFWTSDQPLHRYLIIPQSWTVALELCFYLCAPVLCKLRFRQLLLVMIGLWSLRFTLYFELGLMNDPWVYRFMPVELGVFCSGIFVYHCYELLSSGVGWHGSVFAAINRLRGNQLPYVAIIAVFMVMIEITARVLLSTLDGLYYSLVMVVIFACALPFLFEISRFSKVDRLLAEFSYPVYLIHFFILSLVASYWRQFPLLSNASPEQLTLLAMVVSILLAYFMIRFVCGPIDQIRSNRARCKPCDRLQP